MLRRLLQILGRRTMLTFGLVTFLVAALLATVNITSRYALKLYVDDQLRRIPWDLAVQGSREFTLQVHVQDQPRFIFNTPISSVVRLDRDELNRWLMDQTGSVSYIPYIGAILLMPYEWDVLTKFDQVATGFVPGEVLGVAETDVGHIQMAEYAPEMVYLARIDRPGLISGWDIPGSLANVQALN